MHIAIIGAGYVGLVTGLGLATVRGRRVTFVESDPSRLSQLRRGRLPINEPGLADVFTSRRRQLSFASTVADVVDPDIVFVCVATPIAEDGEPDLRQLTGALGDLRSRPEWNVSVRSTLPPGISRHLPRMLGRADSTRLSTTPEFLRQGTALADFGAPSRIVIGRFDDTASSHMALLRRLFGRTDAPWVEVSVGAAEVIKNAANGFLALKLSFVNEIAALAEEYGVEIEGVLQGVTLDPRIGREYMRPGLGFGGSCLPKELRVLEAAGRKRGVAMHVARAVSQVNLEQQDRFVRRILDRLPPTGATIGLLGLSFKANTDDLRGSPAIHLARRLLDAGHRVVAYDPVVPASRARGAVPGLVVSRSAARVFRGAHAVVIATEWPVFADIDWSSHASSMEDLVIFDGRNLLNADAIEAAGFEYHGVGRVSRGVHSSTP